MHCIPTHVWQNASVKRQLPDVGANSSFVNLRKDLWHPLWTLTLPASTHAEAQRKHTFKKLREWRKLHETNWESPPLLSQPFTEAEIKEIEEKLEDRGGSKKESAHKIIQRKKRKMRVREVLNQRANSVADLAAVLIEQDDMGAKMTERKEKTAKGSREFQANLMLELAREAESDGVKKIEARIEELEELKAKADRIGETGSDMTKSQMRREIQALRARKNKMQWSARMVADVRKNLIASRSQPPPEGSEVSASTSTDPTPATATHADPTKITDADLHPLLPAFPTPRGDPPKRGPIRAKIRLANAPIFSTEGVTIKWSNTLDAEYAEQWPDTIQHEPMGLVRHRAPRADEEAVNDVATLRGTNLRVKEGWMAWKRAQKAEGSEEREALEKAGESVLEAVRRAVEVRKREYRMQKWGREEVPVVA